MIKKSFWCLPRDYIWFGSSSAECHNFSHCVWQAQYGFKTQKWNRVFIRYLVLKFAMFTIYATYILSPKHFSKEHSPITLCDGFFCFLISWRNLFGIGTSIHFILFIFMSSMKWTYVLLSIPCQTSILRLHHLSLCYSISPTTHFHAKFPITTVFVQPSLNVPDLSLPRIIRAVIK